VPLVSCQERYPADQSRGRDESILTFQYRILSPEFCITTCNGLRDLNLTVTREKKENRSALSVRKPLLSQ
jgi:hypothetical protein